MPLHQQLDGDGYFCAIMGTVDLADTWGSLAETIEKEAGSLIGNPDSNVEADVWAFFAAFV